MDTTIVVNHTDDLSKIPVPTYVIQLFSVLVLRFFLRHCLILLKGWIRMPFVRRYRDAGTDLDALVFRIPQSTVLWDSQ